MAIRIAVLLSGSGSSLENLAARIDKGEVDAEIAVVVSSKPGAFGLERASRRGLPAVAVDRKAYADASAFNDALHAVLERFAPDLVVLAGFLSRLELRGFQGRVMNIHPALIPAFSGQGYYGERVHRAGERPAVEVVAVQICRPHLGRVAVGPVQPGDG